MLRKTVLEVTERATQSGALKRITAGVELLPPAADNGVRYLLFQAQSSVQKPVALALAPQEDLDKASSPPLSFLDPFAEEYLERDLFITQVHDTHNLVLNKFNVVDEHVVLPTIGFEPQEAPLNRADLRAMWTSMRDLDAFAFFNCGYESGASQPHKHMQLMSYPSLKALTGLDMPPLLQLIHERLQSHSTTDVVHLSELPFLHFLHRLELPPAETDVESQAAADHLVVICEKVQRALHVHEYPAPSRAASNALPVAYNLLLTQSFLLVVPRRCQRFEGIEVNSIGFIGSFFVRSAAQRELLLRAPDGPMALLREVTFPPPASASPA